MKLFKALFLVLFGIVLCIIFCGLPQNAFDPSSPGYIKPSLSFDTLNIHNGDTLSIDSLSFIIHGNSMVNIFRWQMTNRSDSIDTAWSTWSSRGTGIDTIKLTQLQPGVHSIHIQTAYISNGDIIDTTLTFYKINKPIIIAWSDTLVKRFFLHPCTLWVKATGTAPLLYQWRQDTDTIALGTADTLIIPTLLMNNTGHYQCIVSNVRGKDTSKAIVLSVIPRFSVKYWSNNANGGNVPIDSNYYEKGARVTVLNNSGNLVKTGYTFKEWNTTANDSGVDYAAGATFTLDSANVILFAQWKINQYDVNFDTRGGSAIAKQTVPYGSFASSPTAPTKTDLTFTGWFKDSSGTQAWIFNRDTVLDNITLYAQWTTKPTFMVKYDANGNTSGAVPSNAINYEIGAKVTVLGNLGVLEKTGHTFAGWNTTQDGSGTSYSGGTILTVDTSNITLYAKWTANSYTISFDSRGGNAIASQTVNFGEKASTPATPTKQGFTFTGWSKDTIGTQAWVFTRDTIFGNMTLYANWTTKPTYIVKYDGNGSNAGAVPIEATNYESEAIVTVLGNTGNFAKTGYSFAGWNTAANDSGIDHVPGSTFTMVAENVTLFAKWKINQYTLIYNGNAQTSGTAPTAITRDFNTIITIPANTGALVKTGFTFSGWNISANGNDTDYAVSSTFTMGATDDTIYAKWTINQYPVKFDAQGGSAILTQTINHGDTAITPTAPQKPGYSFAGWFKEASGITPWIFINEKITGEVTIFAKWTINQYKMSYSGNGNTSGTSPDATTHDYNTTVTVPGNTGALAKTGYLFGGWNTLANGTGTNFSPGSTFAMGATDDTLFAKWNKIDTITFDDQNATTQVTPKTKTILAPATTVDALPTPPQKTGCVFSGWYTGKLGGGTEFKANTVVTANDTVYANWTVTDIDGNVYHAVAIGTQIWMVENLKTTKYSDGSAIPLITDPTIWANCTTSKNPGYCWYNNDIANKATYGALYNWYTVNTGNLAPAGWHVATDSEWTILTTFLEGESVAGGKLKEAGTAHWQSPNTGATNETGFSAFPGGFRSFPNDGAFRDISLTGTWWSSTEINMLYAWPRNIYSAYSRVDRYYGPKERGFSVRCVLGNAVIFDGQGATVTASPTIKTVIPPATTIDALPAAPTKTGYIFNGWFTAPNGGGTPFTASTIVNANLTVYAKWIVKDIDGNVYTTVTIGTQTWIVENLKTTKYNDSSAIPLITDSTIWENCTTSNSPGYCYYNNDATTYKSTYGALYNWYTVNTGKLAIVGWHVATDAEWTTLTEHLGGDTVAGAKLKEASTVHWHSPNVVDANGTGFLALPGGYRGTFGMFNSIGLLGIWWSSSECNTIDAWFRYMSPNNATVFRVGFRKSYGHSVRCVRD